VGFLGVSHPGYNLPSSAVTYARVGIDVAKVLVPKIVKLVIPVGLAALTYAYVYR